MRIDLADKLKTFKSRILELISVVIKKSNDTFQEAVIEGKESAVKSELTQKLKIILQIIIYS